MKKVKSPNNETEILTDLFATEPGEYKIDNRLSIVIGGKGYGEIDWTNVELIWDTKREIKNIADKVIEDNF